MYKVKKRTELALLLCKLLKSCDRENRLVDDLWEHNWYIHFGRSAYGSRATSAFCEVEGTPPKGQLLIDLYGSGNPYAVYGGSMFCKFIRRKKVAAWLIPSYERAVELLQEIANQTENGSN